MVQSSSQGCLIVVAGLKGVGKSLLARELQELFARAGVQAAWMNNDAAPQAALPETLAVERIGRELKESGIVIVDAPFNRQAEREMAEQVAKESDAKFAGLWLQASRDTLEERLKAREKAASAAALEILEKQRVEDVGQFPIYWEKIYAEGKPDKTYAQAIGVLAARGYMPCVTIARGQGFPFKHALQ